MVRIIINDVSAVSTMPREIMAVGLPLEIPPSTFVVISAWAAVGISFRTLHPNRYAFDTFSV